MKYQRFLDKTWRRLMSLLLFMTMSAYGYAVTKTIDGVTYERVSGQSYWEAASCSSTAPSKIVMPEYIDGYPVTIISPYAFQNSHVSKVVIPPTVTLIGNYAFYGCANLKEIILPDGMKEIAFNSFSRCTSLEKVVIPSSVKSISKSFNGIIADSVIYNAVDAKGPGADGIFTGTIKSMVIGADVKKIPTRFIYGKAAIGTLTISENVEQIGDNAFRGADHIDEIYYNAVNCSANDVSGGINWYPVKIIIGDGVKSIPCGFACRNYQLESVSIPASVTHMGKNAFNYDRKVEINYGGTMGQWADIDFDNDKANPLFYSRSLKIDGKEMPVTLDFSTSVSGKIKPYAFVNCKGPKHVIVSDNITEIGREAFLNVDIATADIGMGVLSIGSNAFSKPKKTYFRGNTVPEGLEAAFGHVNYASSELYREYADRKAYNVKIYPFLSSTFVVDGVVYVPVSPSERTCAAIDTEYDGGSKTIRIGKDVVYSGISLTVKNVNEYIGWANSSISRVEIENDVPWGTGLFHKCDSLTYGMMRTAGDIYENPFKDCARLETLVLDNSGNVNDSVFMASSIVNLTVKSRGSIGKCAFRDCKGLRKAEIDVTGEIGDEAFRNTHLNHINVNCSGRIGKYAFSKCQDYIRTIVFGNRISYLDEYSFYYNSFKSECAFTIPSNITEIRDNAFEEVSFYDTPLVIEDCGTALKLGKTVSGNYTGGCFVTNSFGFPSVHVGRNLEYESWQTSPFKRMEIDSVSFSDKVTELGPEMFYDCRTLNNVVLPESLVKIGESAFNNCLKFTEISIPSSVKTIGASAFGSCSKLSSVELHEGIETVGERCFSNTALTSVTIPNSLKSLGKGAFSGCKALSHVTIGNGLTELEESTFSSCIAMSSIDIGENVKKIGQYAFQNCKSLASVGLPKVISVIGQEAFGNCSALSGIVLPDALTDLGQSVFVNCTALRDVKIGSSLEYLSSKCFDNCTSLVSLSLPSTLNDIYGACFKGCSGLADIVIEDRKAKLDFSTNYDGTALFNDTNLKTVYIGGPINYYLSPFDSNQTLETVVISDRETEVKEKEFYGCLNLRNVTIGNDVERIGASAFSACQRLEYFSFGTAMKTIEADAFSDCTSMTTLISKAKVPPTCGNQALDDINKWQCRLTVPYGCEQAYMSADQWKEFFFISVADEIKVSDIELNFTEISLTEGEETQLVAEIKPYDASDSSLIWTSEDTAVATVDGHGTVVALKAGRATVKVSAADGSGVSATCEVVVLPSSGVDGITSDKTPVSVVYFTMSGVALPSLGAADGQPYIQVVKYADGTTVRRKIINR